MTDSELLDRLRRDDRAAFDEIFRAWYSRLVGFGETILNDRAEAEEVVQDVMLGLWRARHTLSSGSSPQAYLFRATRNRALNQIRHRKVQQRKAHLLEVEDSVPALGDAGLAEREIRQALDAALNQLPPRCREVFELSRNQGLSYNEIAETLEISVKTVEAQMSKALRVLRERLAPWLRQ